MRILSNNKILLVTICTLILSMLLAAPVFAEGEIPPETTEEISTEESAPVEESPQPEGEVVPVEEPAAEAVVEEISTEEAEAAFEEPEAVIEQPPVEEGDAEFLPEVLAEADLALAGTDGEVLNMASAGTADAVVTSDPYFMVGTQYYRWLLLGGDCTPYLAAGDICTTSATPIQDAINYIETYGTVPTDRKIYVEQGTFTENVTFDGTKTNLSTLNGLIGVDGSALTTLNGTVQFNNLTGGFTLEGFTISGGVIGHNIVGTVTLKDLDVKNSAGDGIKLDTQVKGAVVLDRVNSHGNSGRGAVIDNDDAGFAYNVTINNSYFDENTGAPGYRYGLEIATLGKISMDGISASQNEGIGIYIATNFSGLTIKNAVIDSNDAIVDPITNDSGIFVYTAVQSNIYLENILAQNEKETTGAAIDLTTGGSVTIKKAYVNNNAGAGMSINNTFGTGAVKVYDSEFNNNTGDIGLRINSHGYVYLSSVSASFNGSAGLFVNNCHFDGSNCQGIAGVMITSPQSSGELGVNMFNNNSGFGVDIQSGKAITIYNIIADNNAADGISLVNTNGSGGITIKKNLPTNDYATFYNSASGNTQDGLDLNSNGIIRVEYIHADKNTFNGAHLTNHNAGQAPGIVVMNGTFHENDQNGLWSQSKGSIALTNVSANKNNNGPYNGVYLDTSLGVSGGVSIKGTKGYTCQFNENGSEGIDIYAYGTVILENVEANDNPRSTYIDNYQGPYTKNVTITNAQFLRITSDPGLEVRSKGSINLKNVVAEGNDEQGAQLRNDYGTGSVSVKNSTFNGNSVGGSWTGLDIDTNKNVTLYDVSASGNGGLGVNIDACNWDGLTCLGSGYVSLNSSKNYFNTFNENGSYGFIAWARGNINVYNVIAVDNGSNGVSLENHHGDSTGNITFSSNRGKRNLIQDNVYGLIIRSRGVITVNYTDVVKNGGGAWLQNTYTPLYKAVKVKESIFNANEDTGLWIEASGPITLQGVEASDNSNFKHLINIDGAWWKDNLSHTRGPDYWTFTASPSEDDYDITLDSYFFDAYLELRDWTGKLIDSDDNSGTGTNAHISGIDLPHGDYTITVMSVDGSGGAYDLNLNSGPTYNRDQFRGARVVNGAGAGAIKVLYSSKMGFGFKAWNNNHDGLEIQANGAVSTTQTETMYNGLGGLHIYNATSSEQPVTLKNAVSEGQRWTGVYVSSRGNISLTNVISIKNIGFGTELYNDTAVLARNVKISKSTFSDNVGDDGIQIRSTGHVTLSSVVSDNPGGDYGADIDNTSGIGNVTVSGKNNSFSNNLYYGLEIVSHGHVTLGNLDAHGNGYDGAYIYNGFAGYDPKNVKIYNSVKNGKNDFNDNGDEGLNIFTYGTVSISKVSASGNPTGNYIVNDLAPVFKSIKISNSNFDGASTPVMGTGLEIDAYGPVYLTNVSASGNAVEGIQIDASTATGQDITLNKVTTNGNTRRGMLIISAGFIKGSYVNSNNNGWLGAEMSNTTGDEGASFTNSVFSGNNYSGFGLSTNGPVQIRNTFADYNGQRGIYVNGDTNYIAVTLYKVTAIGNQQDGIQLLDVVTANVSYTTASMNGSLGYPTSRGLYIGSQASVDSAVTISNSSFMANFDNGVYFLLIDTYTITNTTIFGNDIDGTGEGETNF